MPDLRMNGPTGLPWEMGAGNSETPLPTYRHSKKVGALTLSEYILERLSSKSDMVLVEFSIIKPFPKRFKYKMLVSKRVNEVTFAERDQGAVDSPYC